MPKGGSGFKRAAGNAAKAIFGPRSGRDWSLFNVREGVEAVQTLYGRTYRNNDVLYQYNGRGQLTNIGGKNFDRFAARAEALAKQLAGDVRVIDREAERQYKEMQGFVGKMRVSAQERREFQQYYQGESHINVGVDRRTGATIGHTVEQLRDRGLFTGDTKNMSNVDILVQIHNALNAVKGRISGTVPASQRDVFEAEIFDGLTSRYEGVVKGANRRRRS